MPGGFKPLNPDLWEQQVRRALIIGGPNTFKTTSILTWPRPTHLICMPGELGTATIPQEDGLFPVVWTEDDTPSSPERVWAQVQTQTRATLAGKFGEVKTLAIDGLHKLYQTIYDVKLNALEEAFPDADREKLGGRAYGLAHREFLTYIRHVNTSNVPYAVFTCWAAREKDNPDDKRSKSHYYPDLPGELAKWVLGEFSVVMFAEVGLPGPDGRCASSWLLKPQGAVWGVSVKVPKAIALALPARVPQSWPLLEPLLLGKKTPNHTEAK